MYKLKPIRNPKDYQKALVQVDKLWEVAKPNTPEGDMLDILVTLTEKYEAENFAIDAPDPVEAIKFVMEQSKIRRSLLDEILGGRNRTSEILGKKRKLSLGMIRRLHDALHIKYDILMMDYKMNKARNHGASKSLHA